MSEPFRKKKTWLLVTALAAAAAAAVFLAANPFLQRARLQEDMLRAIRMYRIGYASHIDLDEHTDFAWDQVHMFPPYTTRETVEGVAGSHWPGARWARIAADDSLALLVFMRAGRIVRWVEVPRGEGDFSSVAASGPFTPETALFILPNEGDTRMQVLR